MTKRQRKKTIKKFIKKVGLSIRQYQKARQILNTKLSSDRYYSPAAMRLLIEEHMYGESM